MRRRFALKGTELDPYAQMSDEQIAEIDHNEFVQLVEDILLDLERMEAAVKRRQALYDRMRKTRLMGLLSEAQGKVVELDEMLLQLTEAAGTVSWTNVVKTLKQSHPEMVGYIEELEEQHRGKPVPKILKHRRRDEPKTWKSLEHVPLRRSDVRHAQGVEIDELAETRLLQRINRFLDGFIMDLQNAMRGGMQKAAGMHGYDSRDYRSALDDLYQLEAEYEAAAQNDSPYNQARIERLYEELEDARALVNSMRRRMGATRYAKLDPETLKALNSMPAFQQGSDKLIQFADAVVQQYQQLVDKVVPTAGENPVNTIVALGSAAAELAKRMQEIVTSANQMQKQMEIFSKSADQDPNKVMHGF